MEEKIPWRFSHLYYDQTAKPITRASTAEKLEIGSNDHNLCAFDAAKGHALWKAAATYNINSSPAVVDGVGYLGSDDGKL